MTDSQMIVDDGDPKHALDELFAHVGTYRTSTEYRELIEFVSNFRFYAPYNAMLVHVQKPGARYVAPAHRWHREYRRSIRAGAQPLVMLQPMGPVMFVFDVSDTEGEPLPREIENPFSVVAGKLGNQFSRTIENAARDGIRITHVPQGSQRAGSIQSASSRDVNLRFGARDVPLRYELVLNQSHDAESRYATMVHELAHLYCGHLGSPNEQWWPKRTALSHAQREFEAESVAYLVCRRAGIEPRSAEYLYGYWNENRDIPTISLDCVLRTAGLIEKMGQRKMGPRKP